MCEICPKLTINIVNFEQNVGTLICPFLKLQKSLPHNVSDDVFFEKNLKLLSNSFNRKETA